MSAPGLGIAVTTSITTTHRRRLRAVWRSAGWPFQDLVEVELLAAGLLSRERDAAGRETMRVTDAGLQVLAQTLNTNRAVRDEHEALVARVAREMQRAGRVVWRGLSLRARVGEGDVHQRLPGGGGRQQLLVEADQPGLRQDGGGEHGEGGGHGDQQGAHGGGAFG